MIYAPYLEERLTDFCKKRGIQIINGQVPKEYAEEVKNFLSYQQKADRANTRIQERDGKLKISLNDTIRAMGEKSVFESPIEEFMYKGLIKNNVLDFELQYEIGKYRIDIAFPDLKVAVECDGREYHHDNLRQIMHDQKRDKYLARKGWRVVHIEGIAIRRNIDLCVKKVKEALGFAAEEWIERVVSRPDEQDIDIEKKFEKTICRYINENSELLSAESKRLQNA